MEVTHVRFARLTLAFCLVLALTSAPASATYPGSNGRLAFIHGCCDQYELYATDLDGTTLHQLTDPHELEFVHGPSWSPDGRLVFAARSTAGGSTDLWIMDADGSDLVRLIETGPWERDPAWSQDGTKIAYVRRSDLFVMNATGGGRERLTDTRRFEWAPDWSPDGTHLAFLRDTRIGTDIYLLDIAGGAQERLTRTRADEFYPKWLPDGAGLVFTSHVWAAHQADTSIWTIDATTRATVPLLNDPTIDELRAVVSPDGKEMAWVRVSPHSDPNLGAFSELLVSDLQGNDEVVLDTCVLECSFYDLDWQTLP